MKWSEIHYRIINNQTLGSRVIRGFLVSVSVCFKSVFSPLLTTKQAPSLEKTCCLVLGVPFTLKYIEMALLEICSAHVWP